MVNTKVMGIDLGIAKVAYSQWVGNRLVQVSAMDVSFNTSRVYQLTNIRLTTEAMVLKCRPDYVFIEDVLIGNNRKYSIKLAQTMGAVLAGMPYTEVPPQVIPVNVSTWKKEILGNGHASKEDIRNWLTAYNSAYAELCDGDQDQYDAACIGLYGCLLSRRADKLLEGSR